MNSERRHVRWVRLSSDYGALSIRNDMQVKRWQSSGSHATWHSERTIAAT
jgi:hypothetical protein